VSIGLAAYLWGSLEPTLPPPLDPSRQSVVFLGDSITSGHGLPLESTFPLRLGAALGIEVRNAGISGDTTAGGLRRLDRDVLVHRPKLVVVELGANDVFRRVPRERIFANIRAIVRRLRDDQIGVVLIHLRLGPFGGDVLASGFRNIARDEGARLVENFLDGVAPNLTTDGLHPTSTGHARLAERLEPTLRELLAR
jgi:acyl-CoA thioesterase-1